MCTHDVPYTICKCIHLMFHTQYTNMYTWSSIHLLQMCINDVSYATYKCVHMMFHTQHTNVYTWCSICNIQMCAHDVPYTIYKCSPCLSAIMLPCVYVYYVWHGVRINKNHNARNKGINDKLENLWNRKPQTTLLMII